MNPERRAMFVVLGVSLTLPFALPAQAYLDPSTGTMILQVVLGGIAGLIITAKLYWSRVKQFLGLSSGDDTSDKNVKSDDASQNEPGTYS